MPPKRQVKKAERTVSKAIAKRVLQEAVVSRTRKAKSGANKKKGYLPGFLGSLGGAAGKFFFGQPGETVGKGVGDFFGKITGMGNYSVNKNTLMTDNGPPIFEHRKDGSIMITHRELFSKLSSSTAFASNSYYINPGNSALFPWLSRIATNFQEYQFHGLILEYQSTSADALNSTNTALGTVNIATNYDPVAPAFVSVEQMAAYEFYTFSKPSDSHIHPIECDPKQNVLSRLYTRDQEDVITTSDIRFHDIGKVTIATQGSQAIAEVGKMWVSYSIALYKPQLPTISTATSITEFGHSFTTVPVNVNGNNVVTMFPIDPTINAPFPVYAQDSLDPLRITVSSYNINFKRVDSGIVDGRYMIHIRETQKNRDYLSANRIGLGISASPTPTYTYWGVSSIAGTNSSIAPVNYWCNGTITSLPERDAALIGLEINDTTTNKPDWRGNLDACFVLDVTSLGVANEVDINLLNGAGMRHLHVGNNAGTSGFYADITVVKLRNFSTIRKGDLQNEVKDLTQRLQDLNSLVEARKSEVIIYRDVPKPLSERHSCNSPIGSEEESYLEAKYDDISREPAKTVYTQKRFSKSLDSGL